MVRKLAVRLALLFIVVINVLSYLFLIIAVSTFCGIFICLLLFVRFYNRYNKQLVSIFSDMHQQGLIEPQNYIFYEGLGFSGFGYRVSILSRIVKGKESSLTRNSKFKLEAARRIADKYDLAWVSSFYRMLTILALLLALLIILAFIS
mgnify:CR=1 FL=1